MAVKNNNNVIISLLTLIFVAQLGILFFLIKPVKQPVYQVLSPQQEKIQKNNKALVEKVSKLTKLPKENPVVAEVLDIDTIKKQNDTSKEVYKDAQNGDKILAYKERFIIYRPSTDKIIYDGKAPITIMQEKYVKKLQKVLPKVNQLAHLDIKEIPQMSTITDIKKLKEQNPQLFANAENGDIILAYKDGLVIYREKENRIILNTFASDKKIENK